ncbi:putative glycosyl hydrolase 6 [Abditibacterium utsteinense]|uniref:Putative glycosyl hydrolase 6 n=1 Tax=Abditibacterium utsteinense TaxID=1960156 RepID=A0A2S8SP75_9BACT|nr:alpha-amylase family protein [Abditibacterium utsteinense]PQV62597.1 putative glycosyl hydrolase 6 [Abditibacterium utsteinense]
MKKPLSQFQRQVHLDFHTSPFIPGVASDFDAAAFAQTFVDARVNSVTVFAKCHHGMCYYPTQSGTVHPHLEGRDLLGEQLEALHSRGIRAPIYTTIVWEEDAAARFPQWRQLTKDGNFAGDSVAADFKTLQPGRWKWMNFLHPDYQDYMENHLREIVARYGADAIDGFFLDILMIHSSAEWSESGLKFRREQGLMDAPWAVFQSRAQEVFCAKFARILRGLVPDTGIFFNSGIHFYGDSKRGVRARADSYSHFEVESLPSGFWGYDHFPRSARLVMDWNQEWLSMTGRFQRMWGDFGGIKPQAALEYECFRAQALGGANSVGDQLPPRGILDPAAYKLIGNVFSQVEAAEPFYEGSQAMSQIGIVCPNVAGEDEGQSGKSEEGAVRMCEEAHYDCVMLDDASDFGRLELLILPDSVQVTPALKEKLAAFYQNGGKLVISHRAGFDENGDWALDFLPLQFEGEVEKWPTFWRARSEFEPDLALSDRVHYERGLNVSPQSVEVLVERVLPYFQRTDVTFSSHFQTPPIKEADAFPAVVAGERFVYFADPIFREVRQTGNMAARDGWRAAMKRLVGAAPYGKGLPTTMLSVPRRSGNNLHLTLLHYVPVRKALDIDVIEERSSFGGEVLFLPEKVAQIIDFETQVGLEHASDGGFKLPLKKGRLLLEVPRFFAR